MTAAKTVFDEPKIRFSHCPKCRVRLVVAKTEDEPIHIKRLKTCPKCMLGMTTYEVMEPRYNRLLALEDTHPLPSPASDPPQPVDKSFNNMLDAAQARLLGGISSKPEPTLPGEVSSTVPEEEDDSYDEEDFQKFVAAQKAAV